MPSPSRRTTAQKLERLSNLDMTDREILLAMNDVANSDGLVLAQDVAEYFGIVSNGKRTPAGTVASRLAWMRKYGYVDRIDPKTLGLRASDHPRYIITPFGEQVMKGRIPAGIERAIDSASAGTMVMAMRKLAQRAYLQSDVQVSNAVRREYNHHEARRPR